MLTGLWRPAQSRKECVIKKGGCRSAQHPAEERPHADGNGRQQQHGEDLWGKAEGQADKESDDDGRCSVLVHCSVACLFCLRKTVDARAQAALLLIF